MVTPAFLMGPMHLHAGVHSAADYEALQRHEIARRRARHANLEWRDPWVYDGPPKHAFVTNGQWQVLCDCMNAPLVSVEWAIARCLDCGAVYQPPTLVIPEAHLAIAAALIRRPLLRNRAWMPSESVAQLLAENQEHGL